MIFAFIAHRRSFFFGIKTRSLETTFRDHKKRGKGINILISFCNIYLAVLEAFFHSFGYLNFPWGFSPTFRSTCFIFVDLSCEKSGEQRNSKRTRASRYLYGFFCAAFPECVSRYLWFFREKYYENICTEKIEYESDAAMLKNGLSRAKNFLFLDKKKILSRNMREKRKNFPSRVCRATVDTEGGGKKCCELACGFATWNFIYRARVKRIFFLFLVLVWKKRRKWKERKFSLGDSKSNLISTLNTFLNLRLSVSNDFL